MKRKIFAVSGLVVMLFANANMALAATAAGTEFVAAAGASIQYSVDSGTTYKDLTKLSNNVVLHALINATSDAYAITSKHTQAVRQYGTSSVDTKISYIELATPATAMTTLTAADSSQMSSWTSM